jgi:hypothetical protein
MIGTIVTEYRYPHCTHIVIGNMGSYSITPSCPPLIDESSLTDEIVVSDISPLSRECMIDIYPSDHLSISLG